MKTKHFTNTAEQKKIAYDAFRQLCIKNNNLQMLTDIEIAINKIGARRYFEIWQKFNKGRVPDKPMEIVALAFEYIEDQTI